MSQCHFNDRKICFISCVNDEKMYSMSTERLKELDVPPGMTTEYMAVRDAVSMCAGYQQAMEQSDAKYKIYLHQDVLILDELFLVRLVELFSCNQLCGIAGVVGSSNLPANGVWWEGRRLGAIVDDCHDSMIEYRYDGAEVSRPAMALDGLLLATQYDVPWRCDIFDGWHFYDVSACMEFRRAGYQAVVMGQPETSCAHLCGEVSIEGYLHYHEIFLHEYGGEY